MYLPLPPPPPFLCLNFHKFVRLFFTIFYQGNFMVKNELPNLLVSQEMNYPTHFSSVPTRGINSERSLINLYRWLKANKLSLNIAKTEFMIIGSRQRIQTNCCNHQFNIQQESKNIENVDHTKSLGIFIDKNLSWKKTYYRNIKENSICNWRPKTN